MKGQDTQVMIGGGLILALIGAAMLWGAWATTRTTLRWKAEGIRVEGTVVDLEERRRDNPSKKRRDESLVTYAPVIRYTTVDGQTFRFISSSGTNPAGYDRGDKVAVLYAKGEPGRAHLDSFAENWPEPLTLGGFGLLLGPFGVALVVKGLRRRNGAREPVPQAGLK